VNVPGPDGWAVGFHATPDGWPAPTRRLTEQRWVVESAIRQIGIDWDQGRTRYIGAAGGGAAEPDFARVRDGIDKLADVERVFATAARKRTAAAEAASGEGHQVTAGSHAFIASLLWGAAEWTFFLSAGAAQRAHEDNAHKLSSYDLWMERAPHPLRRLRIPYGNGTLSAVLHLPPQSVAASGSVPAVLHVGGMDSFKEHAVGMIGDRYLQRGIARLVFDGPGQGEAIYEGAFVSRSNMVDAGLAALDVLRAQPEIDGGRLGITGVSFGSWWATQIAARADVRATAVWAVLHEPGLHSIFEEATPTFKARFMAMTGYVDEDAFDAFVRVWSLGDDAARIDHPILVIAGEDDELSPIINTYRLLERMPAPRRLMLYRGERHSIGGGPASRLGPNHLDAAADWFVDRFEDRPAEEDVTVVETSGQVTVEPLDRWLPEALAGGRGPA
jgi:dipeptidyl aminopeptidase/acylaminoacyl peptidase